MERTRLPKLTRRSLDDRSGFPWKSWVKTAFSGVVFLVVVSLLKQALVTDVFIEIAVSLTAGGAVFVFLIFFLGVLTKEELLELKGRVGL